ncbi:PREDICTED: uncharacterized protein LOC109243467 [Nicotiana attenuata]|uniref:uncharacterized protein LOC109243467 n=1 Tax=Nicotiana attenuata TaxID=49451 RepID=UPI0009057A84|nr:PREDICTED: uncharacterized protein LOC109243467 [Nicotiana attenuata]
MKQEVKALEDNKIWSIVDLPNGKNTVGSKWVYKIKYKSNGEAERFKARKQDNLVIVLVYVDDLLITGNSAELIEHAKAILHQQFRVKDLGELKYFLGIEVLRSKTGILLKQRKYILELISELGLSGAKPASTPREANVRLTTAEYDQANGIRGDELLQDINSYQRLEGKLLYVTITRPDINNAVNIKTIYAKA